MLRQAEKQMANMLGDTIKIVEKSGVTLRRVLHKSNPWAGVNCGRENCLPCRSGDEKDCTRRNILYETACLQCKEEGKEVLYVGESARSSQERGKEHQDDYNKKLEKSHMEKHAVSCHSGEKRPTFGMKVVKTHSSALSRQIHEAVRIRRKAKTSTILNSKSEYSRCQLPRLVVETWKKKEILENTSTENPTIWADRDSMKYKRKVNVDGRPGNRKRVRWDEGHGDYQVWGEKVKEDAEVTCNTIMNEIVAKTISRSEQSKENRLAMADNKANSWLVEALIEQENSEIHDIDKAVAIEAKQCHTQPEVNELKPGKCQTLEAESIETAGMRNRKGQVIAIEEKKSVNQSTNQSNPIFHQNKISSHQKSLEFQNPQENTQPKTFYSIFKLPEATKSCDTSKVRGPERIKRLKGNLNRSNDLIGRVHERTKFDSRKRNRKLELSDQQIKKQKKIENYFVKATKGSVSTLDSTSEQATS